LVTLAVVLGLLLSSRAPSKLASPAWTLDLHRILGGFSVVFTAIHLIGLWADSYVEFGWAELFVPMASSWQPGAVAFGIVAIYVLFAVELTSLLRRSLPNRMWRWVHRTSLPLYAMATYHGIAAGSDGDLLVFKIVAYTSIVVVAVLTVMLVRTARRRRSSDLRQSDGIVAGLPL
jgi:DMSO/TMAO reductase YedYZ heme-binding membrane subunit